MNVQKFLQLLSQVIDNYTKESLSLKNNNFTFSIQKLNTNINSNFLELLNIASSCLEEGEIYSEITDNLGETLISSLINNGEIMAYGIIENEKLDRNQINNNLQQFNCFDRVCLYDGNLLNFSEDLSNLNSEDKIGLFYLNGEKSYRDILKNLMTIRPFLAEEAFIIISNIDSDECQEAITDFQQFNINNCDKIYPLLTINREAQLYSFFPQELVILLWQNNILTKEINKINTEGLIKLDNSNKNHKKTLLHVGCGVYNPHILPQKFKSEEWVEIRLDIDLKVKPDIIGSILNLSAISDNSIDAIYSSHNLEHIYNFEVSIALTEFKRVLKPNGFILITLPDIQQVAHHVALGNLETPIYISPAGPICAIDILYGLGCALAMGDYYMAHKTAFTDQTLAQKITDIGFKNVEVTKDNKFNLWAIAYKLRD